jgi:hypothetical protein
MACEFKCPKNNCAYLVYPILHRDNNGFEYLKNHLLCSGDCIKRFHNECTYKDDNGYIYYTKVIDDTRDYCPLKMIEQVDEHKSTSLSKELIGGY